MLQMSAILRTEDLNAFHRSLGVLGQEVSNVTQLKKQNSEIFKFETIFVAVNHS